MILCVRGIVACDTLYEWSSSWSSDVVDFVTVVVHLGGC